MCLGWEKTPVFKGTIFSPSLQIISYDSSDNENKEKNPSYLLVFFKASQNPSPV